MIEMQIRMPKKDSKQANLKLKAMGGVTKRMHIKKQTKKNELL
jgi:hypothetical protein